MVLYSRKNIKHKKGGKLCNNNNNNNSTNNIYTKKNIFKQSTWSTYNVYNNITRKNNKYIVKEIPYSKYKWVKLNNIKEEHSISKIADELGIGPKVVFSKICDGTSYLVMEKIHGKTFNEFTPSKKDEIEKEKLIKIFNDNGYFIGDIDNYDGNFMKGYTLSEPNERVWMIDYGDIKIKK